LARIQRGAKMILDSILYTSLVVWFSAGFIVSFFAASHKRVTWSDIPIIIIGTILGFITVIMFAVIFYTNINADFGSV
jgi:hypothetical protein